MAVEIKKQEPKKITVSVIKADIGGWVGHSAIHPASIQNAQEKLATAKTSGVLVDYHVTACGDDLQLIMTHRYGVDCEAIHRLAWETFEAGTRVAKDLHLYGAGQDLLADAFSGNVRGQGPGVAEMEFIERKSEPILIFMADKTSAGAWNLPLYKMFADPFTTAGLVIAPTLHQGFRFEVHDIREHKKITFDCPEDLYDMLMFIGSPGKYTVKHVFSRADGTIAAASSTERLSLIAGKYVGKDDPVMIVRAQQNFPAVGEVLDPFLAGQRHLAGHRDLVRDRAAGDQRGERDRHRDPGRGPVLGDGAGRDVDVDVVASRTSPPRARGRSPASGRARRRARPGPTPSSRRRAGR